MTVTADFTFPRLTDWPARLTAFLLDMKSRNDLGSLAFDWDPSNPEAENCLTFAGSAMEALFGVNPYTEIGMSLAYTNPREALEALESVGYSSMEDVLSTLFRSQNTSSTKRGDLVLIPAGYARDSDGTNLHTMTGLRWATAVADPPYFWVVSTAYGLSQGPINKAVQSFDTFRMIIPARAS